VAIQCLETVFKINPEDTHLAPPQHLIEMFTNSFHENDMLPLSDSLPEDVEKADQLKDEGNSHMKEENYGAAVDCYTRAIELDPNNAVYYCNRAAAQSKLNNYSEAIKDCERAIAIDPKYSKAYGRMGSLRDRDRVVTALFMSSSSSSSPISGRLSSSRTRDGPSPGSPVSFFLLQLISSQQFNKELQFIAYCKGPCIPQCQHCANCFRMSGMMSNAIGGPAAGVGGLSDLSSLIHAGQQFAQQIQQQNPELIEQLRNHVRSRSFSGSTEEHS
ncbi:SGTB protein, partial [Pygoscelis papua]